MEYTKRDSGGGDVVGDIDRALEMVGAGAIDFLVADGSLRFS